MRTKRILVGVVGGALLGFTPIALATAPAQAGTAAIESRLVLASVKKVYRYDATIGIKGRAESRTDGGAWRRVNAGDDNVWLYRRPAGKDGFTLVATDVPDSEGRFAFRVPSRGTATYAVYYGGSASQGIPEAQRGGDIKGSRNPRGKGDKRSGRLYYQGNVDPGWGRKGVVIQKKACKSCGWKGYRTVRTNKKGGYSARIYAPKSGNWYWRARVKATKPTFVTGYGNVVRTFRVYGRTADGSVAQVR